MQAFPNTSFKSSSKPGEMIYAGFLDSILLALAFLYLNSLHVLSSQKHLLFLLSIAVTIGGYAVSVLLTRIAAQSAAGAFFLVTLLIRSILLALPGNSHAPMDVWLFAFLVPVMAAHLVLRRQVATIFYILFAFAVAGILLMNSFKILQDPNPIIHPSALIVMSFVFLAQAGIYLGILTEDINPTLLHLPAPQNNEDDGEQLTHTELAEALSLVMRIGSLMIDSGAASFRTEQVMIRIAKALRVQRLDVYMTPVGIIASAYSGAEHRTQTSRITRLGVSMSRVMALENYSHHIQDRTDPADVRAVIAGIEKEKPIYPPAAQILAAGAACGALAVVMGGGVMEVLAAGVGAGFAQSLRLRLAHQRTNPLILTMLCAALATFVSILVVRLIHAPHPKAAVAACVLLLVPGVPLVTSIVDFSRLDILPGISRGVLALLLFTGIAMGMLIVLIAMGFNIF
jgi:uncharacterized membrane protein YjjP (DUF1212 family)